MFAIPWRDWYPPSLALYIESRGILGLLAIQDELTPTPSFDSTTSPLAIKQCPQFTMRRKNDCIYWERSYDSNSKPSI